MAFLPGLFGRRGVFGSDGAITRGLSYLDPTRSSGTIYAEHPVFGAFVSPLGTMVNQLSGHGQAARDKIVGGFETISGAKDARDAAEAQQQAIAGAQGDVNKYYQQATDYQQPLYEQGMKDYATLGNMVRGGEFDIAPQQFVNPEAQPGAFAYGPQSPGAYVNQEQQPGAYVDQGFKFDPNEDPGARFRMEQGTNAINSNAAARGGGLSGATLKALARYGSDLGSQEYGAAFGRYNTNRNFGYNAAQDRLGQFNVNRAFGAGQNQQNIENWQNNRNFAYGQYGDRMNQYNTNRNFNYDAFNNLYDQRNQQAGNRYNRLSNLANVGTGTAANLGTIAMNRGDTLGNLSVQGGNARAAGIVAPGNANRALFGDLFKGVTQLGTLAAKAYTGGAV